MATSHNAIKKDTDDLKHYPNVETSTFDVITVGDLHGNALKLLHFLLKNNIVHWNTSEKSESEAFYQRFYELYNATPITQEKFNQLRALISSLRVTPNTPLLRFIGDELADRGKHDLITLLLFEHLHANKVNYRCILSNHTHRFLINYNKMRLGQPVDPSDYGGCFISQSELFSCIENGFIELDEVNRLVDNHKNHLYILDHGLYDQGTYQYTHAVTSHTIGQHLAQPLNLFYFEATPVFRVWSTSRVNQAFRQRLMCDDWDLFNTYIMDQLSERYPIDEQDFPFESTLWNRTYRSIQRPTLHPEYAYEQRSIHGHERNDPLADDHFIISLDSLFGKGTIEKEINPIFYHQETVLNSEELAPIEKQVKDYIRNDLETIEDSTLPALEYLGLLHKKVNLYQQAFVDPVFTEIYPLIIRLIEKKYCHQMTYLFSSENSNTMPFSEEIQSFASQIKRTIELFKKHRLNTQNLDQILLDVNEQYKKRQCTELNIHRFIHYIWEKQNDLDDQAISLPYLTPALEKLSQIFNDSHMTIGKRIKYFTENEPLAELQRAALDDCQNLLEVPPFDMIFIERAPVVLTILKELNTQDISQQKELQKELDYANQYSKKQEYARGLRQFIEQSTSHYPNNPLCKTLRQLANAYAVKANDQSINFSTRTTWFNDYVSEIGSIISYEIKQLQDDAQKELTDYQIISLLARISFLKQLDEQIKTLATALKPSGHTRSFFSNPSATPIKLDDKRFGLITTTDFQNTLLALEQQVLNAQEQLRSLLPLRKSLIVSCHYYQTHLSQQGSSPLNEEKKRILADMLETLAWRKESQCFSKSSIATFIEQFHANRERLKYRKSICGVQIENQGKMRKLLNFFQSQEKVKLSKGSNFIDEIEEALIRQNAINTPLSTVSSLHSLV